MHMIALGWVWVVFMMAITEKNIVAGVMTFVFYGIAPCALLLYWVARQRRIKRMAESMQQKQGADASSAPDHPES